MQRNFILVGFLFWVVLLVSGCSQKPVPWVKETSQKMVDQLGFEKDRGSYMVVPEYYRDSNRLYSEEAGKVIYLQEQ
ncbi:hypothetical protein [Thiomicrorhabdus xiamenensis]|uniref:Lipoprotein n=1 Tax=Thiomicrorhabdus xiamenensis TaxID=2739063 RepID=A0A7D4P520_9GAMM|nr:hypothetical protein [Thiomicrorhabdus xiamenensis]QKI89596.1 hypothetical protein HQN79_08455 [Thiomicrorhabdus xiamenensis]